MPLARITLAFAFAVLTVGCASGPTASCAAGGADIACTGQGAVRGVAENGMLAFKGMPYARPPVGDLRWRPPEAPVAWQGVRDGSQFGAMCPQLAGKDLRGAEDCLYINVWRPRTMPATALPVMVWLTGGGNHSLSGEGSDGFGGVSYQGGTLVPHGVVVVTYNPRLGVLGFLAHPSLDAERPEKISGNYGSLDQVAMLRWVNRNIAAFGGDPNKVFLFGTSAGGGNICALMTSPMTRGLIHGVSMQSSVPMGCEIQTLADAQSGTGRKVASLTGCDSAPNVAACLRGKSVSEIVSAVPGTFTVLARLYGPNVDGHVFAEQPIKLLAQGKFPAMPVIIGNTFEETSPWANTAGNVTDQASYGAAVEKVFGAAQRDRVLTQYPASSYPSPRAAFVRVTTDAEFTCQSRRVARTLFKAQKPPVYRYVFAHAQDGDPALKAGGAAHTLEHAYLFPARGKYQPTAADTTIAKQMAGYWTRMAATGNPNGGADPQWPAWSPEQDGYLEISANTGGKRGPADAKCDFWDTVTFPWPHL
jgi:para-nitrobenzyl esterase